MNCHGVVQTENFGGMRETSRNVRCCGCGKYKHVTQESPLRGVRLDNRESRRRPAGFPAGEGAAGPGGDVRGWLPVRVKNALKFKNPVRECPC